MVHSDTGKYMFEKFKSENPKVKREMSIMPCPFAGPKIFWVDPRFLCRTKNLLYIVPDKEMICIQ